MTSVTITRTSKRPQLLDAHANGWLTRWILISMSAYVCLAPHPTLAGSISDLAYGLLTQRVTTNQTEFYLFQDADSGFNHGFLSGEFGSYTNISLNPACLDDPNSPTGCTTSSNALDRLRGTVLQITFAPLPSGQFVGLNIEEPENWGVLQTGVGYDLRGATSVVFEARSPTPGGILLQFGVDGHSQSNFISIGESTNFNTIIVGFDSLGLNSNQLAGVHILFSVVANDVFTGAGGTVLLDNIHFDPVPASQRKSLGLPLSTQTFGVVPNTNTSLNPAVPQDQALRNVATIYESALSLLAFVQRGQAADLTNAQLIADSFHNALHHDTHGDPLPTTGTGDIGLHNAYSSGDLQLHNNQPPPALGQSNDVRLAGFRDTGTPSGYALVLDGTTAGNNAWAIIALLTAYQHLGNTNYLDDARMIGRWIVGNLIDTNLGGYFVGYGDGVGEPKPLETGKSIENNAELFAAFTHLAMVEQQLSNTLEAATWTSNAYVAGDFVMTLFDSSKGRFNVGTYFNGTNLVVDMQDFLDANTLPTLAMAESTRYSGQIDWRQPLKYVLQKFTKSISAGDQHFTGFSLVTAPMSGADGIAWEFTAQAVVTLSRLDRLYGSNTFGSAVSTYTHQIQTAQTAAPFGDGFGLVASTLQNGDLLPLDSQCLNTPFQCIPERVGLAASAWAIFAEQQINPLSAQKDSNVPTPILTGIWSNFTQTCKTSHKGLACRLKGILVAKNIGYSNTPASAVQFYLATAPSLTSTNQLLKQITLGSLKPAGSKKLNFQASLPLGMTASGKYVIGLLETNKIPENVIVEGPIP